MMIEFNNSSKFLRKAMQAAFENRNINVDLHIALENLIMSRNCDTSHFSYETRLFPVTNIEETLRFAPRPERTGILVGHIKVYKAQDNSPITLNFYINHKGLWFINMSTKVLIKGLIEIPDALLPEVELSICHPDNPLNTSHARAIKSFSSAYDNFKTSFHVVHFKKLIAVLWETKDIDLNLLEVANRFFMEIQDDEAHGLTAKLGLALCIIFDNNASDQLLLAIRCLKQWIANHPNFAEALEVQAYFNDEKVKQDIMNMQQKIPTYTPQSALSNERNDGFNVPLHTSIGEGVFKKPLPRRPKQ